MVVLIPAYEPGHRLLDLVYALRGNDIVVVDDGSGPAYAVLFETVRALGATVLTHPTNRGKGAALKTGFAYVAKHHPGADVVCADSDGQHSVVDIRRVAEHVARTGRMVLGARAFDGAVPLRSKLGNTVTRVVFAAATGRLVRDTQTGLRGYPADLLAWLLSVRGDRSEYEITVLLRAARRGLPIEETTVATIYLDGNASSHFRPLVDSVRVYAPMLRFAASSLLAFLVDAVLLFVLFGLTGALLLSVLGARAVSSTTNFLVNRRVVFARGTRNLTGAAVRYWGLVGSLAVANYCLLAVLTGAGLGLLPAKVLTESVLFVASYLVQRVFVFAAVPVNGRVVPVNNEETTDGRKSSVAHSRPTAEAQGRSAY